MTGAARAPRTRVPRWRTRKGRPLADVFLVLTVIYLGTIWLALLMRRPQMAGGGGGGH